jgi:alpha-beta hydrolase superfamily lysophospholipase
MDNVTNNSSSTQLPANATWTGTSVASSNVFDHTVLAAEAVIREWSLRWGKNVSGWWTDGCYHADKMYRHADAPDIHCPVRMNAGLIAPVSPPHGVWAVFNRLGSKDKSLVALDGHGHDWSAEFDRRAWKWLDRVLNKTIYQGGRNRE